MIQVGDWLHVRPSELTCERISATQLNKHKNRVQQPFFRLMIGDLEVLVNGKKMFWALLDALFAEDPLPRTLVNQMLLEDPNEFLHDLNSFFDESKTPYISIMLGEVADPYSTVGKLWADPGAVLITANSGLKAPDCVGIADRHGGFVVSGGWHDSKGYHEVPCVVIEREGFAVHIHDLASQLVVGAVIQTSRGYNVRPLPPTNVRKGPGWPSGLAATIVTHTEAGRLAEGRLYPPLNDWKRPTSSSELAAKEFEAFMRGVQG